MKRFLYAMIAVLAGVALLVSCGPQPTYSDYVLPTPNLIQTPTVLDHVQGQPASASRLSDPHPNIIVILTDDQPFHTVDYMPEVKHVLMANGVVFENGFVTTPLCCPSRASILTGEYVHNHQVYTDRMPMGGAQKFNDVSTIATWLQDGGYKTAYYGKYLNAYEDLDPYGYVPPGWSEWGAFLSKNLNANDDTGNLQFYYDFSISENGTPVTYPRDAKNFSADVVTSEAVNFINASRDTPFFLFLGYYNPHSPYVSAPRHKGTFRSGTDWDWIQYRPPNFNEKDISDKPKYIGTLSPLSETEIDTAHKQILRSLLSVDDGVATILSELKETNLTNNTIIFYLSDNGMTLGDHRFGVTKNCPYEACIKVPFIVYAPGYYAPRVDTHMVANIDLAPTIADLAGVPIPSTVNGISMVPLLKNPNAAWRKELLFEHWPTEEGVGSMIPQFSSIRTDEWKYTEYTTGEVELYNLVNDPYELQNVAGKKEYKDIQAQLAADLQKLKKQ